MDRIHHDATPSKELEHPRWLRLERRASTMLLQAVPEAQREELVSAKRLTALKVVCHLLMTYQPGGLAEKEVILSNLENPPEAVTVPEALQSLRRWARRRRASELAVTEPDPYLLLKGLARIVKKPLEGNKELAFRVGLARNNLQVDSNPTARSVGALATHLTAELEQIAHLDPNTGMPKKLASPPREQSTQKVDVRLKKMEGRDSREAGGGSKGEGKGKDARSGETCRFFLTDQGCKKGEDCQWAHQVDDQKRCWNCGGRDHFADKCTRPSFRNPEGHRGSKGEGKGARSLKRKEDDSPDGKKEKEDEKPKKEDEVAESGKGQVIRMLRKITKDGEDQKETKISQLQKQLDELKSVKVLRLARIQEGGARGLLDSGATHPLRGRREGEKMKGYKEVTVSLAGGKEANLHVTKEGIMVAKNPGTEPIVPMGMVVDLLSCRVAWDEDEVCVMHLRKGKLEVVLKGGCPEISKEDALMLIEEIEEKVRSIRPETRQEEEEKKMRDEEMGWLQRILDEHPAFRKIPQGLKEKILEPPADDIAMCGNRRLRKKWAKEGAHPASLCRSRGRIHVPTCFP